MVFSSSSSSSSFFAVRMSPRSFASRSMAPSAARSRPAPPSAKTPSRSLDSRAGPSHDVGARARYSSGNQSEEDETGRGRAREENNPSSLGRCYPNVFNQPGWAVQSFSTGWAGDFICGAERALTVFRRCRRRRFLSRSTGWSLRRSRRVARRARTCPGSEISRRRCCIGSAR